MKVLLPVDGSDSAKSMLSYIAAHDELLGAGHVYTIVTAVPFIPARVASVMSRGAIDDYYREQAEEVVATCLTIMTGRGDECKTACGFVQHHRLHGAVRLRKRAAINVTRASSSPPAAEDRGSRRRAPIRAGGCARRHLPR